MFVLKRNNKTVKKFATYEEARSHARKIIRKEGTVAYYKMCGKTNAVWDGISRNPSNITAVGFAIVAN